MYFTLSLVFTVALVSNLSPNSLVCIQNRSVTRKNKIQYSHFEHYLYATPLRKNSLLEHGFQPRSCLAYLTIILLAASNDIESNPGPSPDLQDQSTIYPCGTCDKPVTWENRAVLCDNCDQWYHIHCQDVHSKTYSNLNEDSNIRWDCIICDQPNYSVVCYDLLNLETSNHFSVLSDTPFDSPDPSRRLEPIHSSTPNRTQNHHQKKTKPFRILNINCQSIKKKQCRLEDVLESLKPDAVIATATWLDPSITDNQAFPANYKIWRRDRTTSSGGGVLIAIEDDYISNEVPELQTDCEIIWTRINFVGRKDLYVCSYYTPKTSDEHSLSQLEESLHRASNIQNSFLIVGGDFNLPGWDWKRKILKPNTQHPNLHYKLTDILDDHGLVQLVEEPTRNNNILDLMLTNLPSKVQRVEVIPGIADHDIVFTELDLSPVIHRQTPRQIPLYRKAKWDNMRTDMKEIQNTTEEMTSSHTSINEIWDTFQVALEKSSSLNIPSKTAKRKDGSPWITDEIRKLIKKRDRLYKKKKKSADKGHIEKFKTIKHLIQKKQRHAYWNYIEDIILPKETETSTTSDKNNSKKDFGPSSNIKKLTTAT
ncbi:hypothetical protein SNE40_004902 [Patella caerulea]|uniref:PHD-type domain-containing protein n=1 Tax=Patella caerulea TaxID=87958 RepID=A0AAN8PYQ1_PATCE